MITVEFATSSGPRSAVKLYDALIDKCDNAGCKTLKNFSSCTFHAPDIFQVGNHLAERDFHNLLVPS